MASDDLGDGLSRLAAWVDGATLSTALRFALAQRLVPRLCRDCRKSGRLTDIQRNDLAGLELGGQALFHAQGCAVCAGRGYRGRQAIFWGLEAQPWLAATLAHAAGAKAVRDQLRAHGIEGLLPEGLRLAQAGDVSADTLAQLAQQELC